MLLVYSVTLSDPAFSSCLNRRSAGLVALLDDVGDVFPVVPQRSLMAGVEATLDAEDKQHQHKQPGAGGDPTAQHDLLAR